MAPSQPPSVLRTSFRDTPESTATTTNNAHILGAMERTNMNSTKSRYRSKTLWFNAFAAGLAALEMGFNLLQPLLPVNFYLILAVALPVINSMLRVVTTEGLS